MVSDNGKDVGGTWGLDAAIAHRCREGIFAFRAGGWARKLLGELGYASASPNLQAQQRILQLGVPLIAYILKG